MNALGGAQVGVAIGRHRESLHVGLINDDALPDLVALNQQNALSLVLLHQ